MPPYLSEDKTCVNQCCFAKNKAADTKHRGCRAGFEELTKTQGGTQQSKASKELVTQIVL